VIDFKKEGIDWRCKTRMRSNSNEFLDTPTQLLKNSKIDPSDSDDTILSDDSDLMVMEGHHTILVSSVGS
jgi:hypothetical protein